MLTCASLCLPLYLQPPRCMPSNNSWAMSPSPSPSLSLSPRQGLFWLWLLTLALLVLAASGSRESQLRIGKAINLFLRYGYLGISMRVIPFNDSAESERWIFKEPTRNIYKVHYRKYFQYLSRSIITSDSDSCIIHVFRIIIQYFAYQ